ncbi:MAG: SLBB domain-containing protein [Bacteroidota bacterium]
MRRSISRVVLLFLLAISFFSYAQDIDDLSKLNVDDLSDAQIEAYMIRVQESGLTMEQLELLARQRGMSSSQISKLRQRVLKVQTGETMDQGIIANENRIRANYAIEDKVLFFDDLLTPDSLETETLPIFGAKIFESALTFESPSNVATPESYVLGPGDEVIIDIYGASEITYQQTISPDGKILISGVGPISLGGVPIRTAKSRVFNQLSSIYSGLEGSRPNTYMDLSVGDIRTITVNVVGNVKRPGTYALSSFSSAFNALYEAGGPDENGSMRQIDIIRLGERIATLDIYKYFFEGDISGNPPLQEGDAIVVKAYTNRVVYAGEVKQPAVYEFLEGESYSDLLGVSGGATAIGYTDNVTLFRSNGKVKSLKTFGEAEYDKISLYDGDSIYIVAMSDTYGNRVKIEGAVEQPGFYELKENMKLSELLSISNLSKDAYLERGNIIRLENDLSLSNQSFDLISVLSGESDYLLRNEDLVKIPSILDIEERKTVSILGEIRNEGDYPFVEGMTVEDLITISGGLLASANTSKVEVARRVSKDSKDFKTAIIFNFKINSNLSLNDSASTFRLKAFDLVTIKASALFRTQKLIKIEGEVMRPGFYALETEEDRLTDLIRRAGGLTFYAYPEGASLIRDLNLSTEKEKEEEEEEEERTLETTSTDEGDFYRKQQLEGLIQRDSVDELNTELLAKKEAIGIQLDKALKSPKSNYNIILEDGDVISIPKELQTVRVRGEVLYPTRVMYDKVANFRDYISLAGGFSDDAQIKRSYIVYANGRAKRTNKFLFFKVFPSVEPGADIFVPEKPERRKVTPGEVLGITGGLASLSLIIVQMVNLLD